MQSSIIGTRRENTHRGTPHNLVNEKSTLVQVMAILNQRQPNYMSSQGFTKPYQRVYQYISRNTQSRHIKAIK